MGLDAINGSTLRVSDSPRPSSALPAAGAAGADAPRSRPEVQGVPRRIGVQQQLPPNTRFRIDKESNRVVAQILDENDEVVRQIPPEALLKLSSRISRLEGLLFNQES